MSSGEGVGVVGAQDPHVVGEELFEGCGGAGGVARFAPPAGEVVSSGEGAGVVGTQNPYAVCGSPEIVEGSYAASRVRAAFS